MSFARRVQSLLTFAVWVFAIGHIVLFHDGAADGGAQYELLAGAHHHSHDGDAPAEDDDHDRGHHHDLAVLDGGKWTPSARLQSLAPVWADVLDAFVSQFTITAPERKELRVLSAREHAPPDGRAFGWLLVVQTARPVRGPSLAA